MDLTVSSPLLHKPELCQDHTGNLETLETCPKAISAYCWLFPLLCCVEINPLLQCALHKFSSRIALFLTTVIMFYIAMKMVYSVVGFLAYYTVHQFFYKLLQTNYSFGCLIVLFLSSDEFILWSCSVILLFLTQVYAGRH